jgi:hypothetical protein
MAIVRVVRVLCTKNHLVLAAPFDDGRDEFWVEETKNRVQALINKKTLSNYCSICGCRKTEWDYQVTPSQFTDLETALRTMTAEAMEKRREMQLLHLRGLTYKSHKWALN